MRSWLMGTAVGLTALGFTTVGVSSLAWSAGSNTGNQEEIYQQLDLFAEILARVDSEYVVDVDDSDAMPHEAFLRRHAAKLTPLDGVAWELCL